MQCRCLDPGQFLRSGPGHAPRDSGDHGSRGDSVKTWCAPQQRAAIHREYLCRGFKGRRLYLPAGSISCLHSSTYMRCARHHYITHIASILQETLLTENIRGAECVEKKTKYLVVMSALASTCTEAFSSGSCSGEGRASLLQQFPGCCLLRYYSVLITLPAEQYESTTCSGRETPKVVQEQKASLGYSFGWQEHAWGWSAWQSVPMLCRTVLPMI